MIDHRGTFPVMQVHREWDAVHDALAVVLPKTYGQIVSGVTLETVPELAHYLEKRQHDLFSFAESHEIDSRATLGYAPPEEVNRGIFTKTVIARWSRLTELLHRPNEYMPELVAFVARDILLAWSGIARDLPASFLGLTSVAHDNLLLPTEVITFGDRQDICFISVAQAAARPLFPDIAYWLDFCWQLPTTLLSMDLQ